MIPRITSRLIAAGACILVCTGTVSAQDALHEVYFHDLAKNRIGNMIVVQANPETEILVFNGGELALEGGNLIVIARHARIDADTVVRSFTQVAKIARPGQPNQAARGADGANAGDAGANGASGASGIDGDNGAAAGKLALRIGEITGKGRLIVDLYGQDGGKGQHAVRAAMAAMAATAATACAAAVSRWPAGTADGAASAARADKAAAAAMAASWSSPRR